MDGRRSNNGTERVYGKLRDNKMCCYIDFENGKTLIKSRQSKRNCIQSSEDDDDKGDDTCSLLSRQEILVP